MISIFKKKAYAPAQETKNQPSSIFSTELPNVRPTMDQIAAAFESSIQATPKDFQVISPNGEAIAMDGMDTLSAPFQQTSWSGISDSLVLWYGSQSFIGYQLCAILAQNWLISKACLMPARDAVRNGFETSVEGDAEISQEIMDALKKADKKYKLNKNLVEFVKMGRVFGIRIAMFIVDGIDYEAPFNIDGVKKGAYKGISQIDPYWITPELDGIAAGDPASLSFYEPTYWRVSGRRIHKSHLVIYRGDEVPDVLKPTYRFGGISVPQKIAERVYAAERTANEAPMLAMTKRTTSITTDLTAFLANQAEAEAKLQQWTALRDNYGVKILGENEKMEQSDTSLADLDAVIMTQYQIVAAAANVPATKLLGTTPKGFNSTGAYEEKSYHEELETIQENDLSAIVRRHRELVIRSEICPKFKIKPFDFEISWRPVSALSATEQASVNLTKAQAGQTLIDSGAIDPYEERMRLINDPDSGYGSLSIAETSLENENAEETPVI